MYSNTAWKTLALTNEVVDAVGMQRKRFTPHGTKDDLGLILLGYKGEPRNYFYSFCKMKPRPWFLLHSSHAESSANPNLITVLLILELLVVQA